MDKKKFTLQELANFTSTTLIGDPNHIITGIETLDEATNSDASFLGNPMYEQAMRSSSAGVVFVTSNISLPENRNFLVGDNPSEAFQKTAEAMLGKDRSITGFKGVHPTAVVHPSAIIGENVNLGPYVVVDENVSIGKGSCINAHCYIGPRSQIGENCLLHASVTVREGCTIGNNVIIQPGTVIGSCGFGYTTSREGRHSKLNQLGSVTIEDDVEIGANTTIDRARFKDTTIKRGTKIDNLVQIGHGVTIGDDNLIVAQTGIAGSTETGQRVLLAGQVAVAGHLKICNDVAVGGRAAIGKSIQKPGKYSGHPLLPLEQHNRNLVLLRNITTFVERLKEIEARLAKLQGIKTE